MSSASGVRRGPMNPIPRNGAAISPPPSRLIQLVRRRWLILSVSLSFLVASGVFGLSRREIASGQGLGYVEHLMSLSEDKIDVGTVALTLAKEFHPGLNVAAYSRKIDDLARKVREATQGEQNPEIRIMLMNQVIYKDEGYGYNKELDSPEGGIDFLNRLLDTKTGNCFTLPTLYMAVAQRLGYPVYPVFVPGHFFLRYVDPALNIYNIEITNDGKFELDENYIRDLTITPQGLASGGYLRTMPYRDFVAYLLDNSGNALSSLDRFQEALTHYEKSVELDPLCIDCYGGLERAYTHLSMISEDSTKAIEYYDKALQSQKTAHALGYVDKTKSPFWRKKWGI